ncbi:MAG TPA: hypothetical protein VGR73_02510 [Bryobacteraceae bacterium]|nr:hypothetical protein [Bryobacteraceae bacterium]
MNPTSVPAIPAQPDQATYGPAVLALFKTFSRDTYFAAFGVQAPAWDALRAPKFWFDSTVDVSTPSNVAVYKVVDSSSGTPALRQLVIPAAEAAAVNIPGAVTYAPYVIAPTGTTRAGAGVNPQYLSLQTSAADLMRQLGGSGLADEGASTQFPAIYPANEPRRMWTFLIAGNPVNVGMLLAAFNSGGMGAPGRWDLSTGFPQWIAAPADPTGLDDRHAARPLPVRDLLPNEELQAEPLGLGGALVVRTDLVQANSAGFTPDDRKLLQQIFAIVNK